MLTDTDLYEMGWNDVAGNLRRAYAATAEQKREWAQRMLAGDIKLPRHEPDYVRGTADAATAFVNGDDLPFKGPADVVEAMVNATGG